MIVGGWNPNNELFPVAAKHKPPLGEHAVTLIVNPLPQAIGKLHTPVPADAENDEQEYETTPFENDIDLTTVRLLPKLRLNVSVCPPVVEFSTSTPFCR